MPRPRIGLTLDVARPDNNKKRHQLNADYVDAVLRAGGLPVLLPSTADKAAQREMVASLDALILPGGDDLDPSLFGQERHARTRLVDGDRQESDFAVLALAEALNLPVLGICLGCQLMNVHRRGTLHQHLPEADLGAGKAMEHSRPGTALFHGLAIRPETLLARIFPEGTLEANSHHHQGIARVGEGLAVAAVAPDGLVEAVEDPGRKFWLAVQWHPERLGGTAHDRLFSALVAAAAARIHLCERF